MYDADGMRTVTMHRDVVEDFDRVRPGDRIAWYHGTSNRDQWGTVVAWAPSYRLNAVGEIVCLKARAVIQCSPGYLQGRQVVEHFGRYGSGIKLIMR